MESVVWAIRVVATCDGSGDLAKYGKDYSCLIHVDWTYLSKRLEYFPSIVFN